MSGNDHPGWLSEAAANNLQTIVNLLTVVTLSAATAALVAHLNGSIARSRNIRTTARNAARNDPERGREIELEHLISADDATILIAQFENMVQSEPVTHILTKLRNIANSGHGR